MNNQTGLNVGRHGVMYNAISNCRALAIAAACCSVVMEVHSI